MKIPIRPDNQSLCEQCVGLCCRYYALPIEKPKNKRDFEDIRWYLLHEDSIMFVEDGEWFLQVNRKCKALKPDNLCAVYENRPTICRAYKDKSCDWEGDEYDYEHVFTEPEHVERFAKEYLTKRRKRRAAAKKRASKKTAGTDKPKAKRKQTKKTTRPIRLLKSA